jgi:predicted CXXCH cytochrome family protein
LAATGSFEIEQIRSLCTGCHAATQDFAAKQYHHNLDDDRSCANCHNAHASNTASLLNERQPVLCMSCHFNEEGRESKEKYITHPGTDCSNCHSPHGGDNAKYLNSEGVDLCVRCHEAAHSASHPVGEGIVDPRTGKNVTCRSCHTMHGSGWPKYLSLDPQMELCIQCHRK